MSNIKVNQKELKAPDQFQTRMLHVIYMLDRYKIHLILVAVAVVLVVGGWFGFVHYQDTQAEKRLSALAEVEDVFAKEAEVVDGKQAEISKKISELELVAKKGQKDAKLDPQTEKKKAELEKEMAAIKPNHEKSLKEYQAFYEKFKNEKEGWVAGLKAASILIDMKKFEPARDLVAKIMKSSLKNPFYQVQTRMLYISIQEELGDYKSAISEADVLLGLVGDEEKPKVLLMKGRLQYFNGAKEDASSTFATIIEKHASSPEAKTAQAMQNL